MNRRITYLLLTLLASISFSYAQKNDTVYISQENIRTGQLKEGKHVYLVYFRTSRDATRTMAQFWTREVKKKTENGRKVIEITQSLEDKDSIVHTSKSICDAKTFRPIYHEDWWNNNGTKTISVFDYEAKKAVINGKDASQDVSEKGKRTFAGFMKAANNYHLNWHVDLEVFPALPFARHKTFAVPFYHPGFNEPENIFYTVAGEGKLTGYDDTTIDCWIVYHESKGNKEQFWISKKTNEVLKLENEINGKMYRYKIKLGYTDAK